LAMGIRHCYTSHVWTRTAPQHMHSLSHMCSMLAQSMASGWPATNLSVPSQAYSSHTVHGEHLPAQLSWYIQSSGLLSLTARPTPRQIPRYTLPCIRATSVLPRTACAASMHPTAHARGRNRAAGGVRASGPCPQPAPRNRCRIGRSGNRVQALGGSWPAHHAPVSP